MGRVLCQSLPPESAAGRAWVGLGTLNLHSGFAPSASHSLSEPRFPQVSRVPLPPALSRDSGTETGRHAAGAVSVRERVSRRECTPRGVCAHALRVRMREGRRLAEFVSTTVLSSTYLPTIVCSMFTYYLLCCTLITRHWTRGRIRRKSSVKKWALGRGHRQRARTPPAPDPEGPWGHRAWGRRSSCNSGSKLSWAGARAGQVEGGSASAEGRPEGQDSPLAPPRIPDTRVHMTHRALLTGTGPGDLAFSDPPEP